MAFQCRVVHKDLLIPLESIKDENDVKRVREEANAIVYSIKTFKEKFPNIETKNIYFHNSLYMVRTIYMDMDKYIYKEIPIYGKDDGDIQIMFFSDNAEEEFLKIIKIWDGYYKKKDIESLIYSAPDGFRFAIFNKMIKDNYIPKDKIYEKFIELYTSCDFGFNNLSISDYENFFSNRTKKDVEELNKSIDFLEDEVVVYRGEGENSSVFSKSSNVISWTLDINIANFFANRLSTNNSKIIKAVVKKEDILAYLPDRSEEEVLIYPKNIKVVETINSVSAIEIQDINRTIAKMFGRYKVLLRNINEDNGTQMHNKKHSLRVLYLSLIMGHLLKLKNKELELLSIAAINHDRGRVHDSECEEHGERSYEEFLNDKSVMFYNSKWVKEDDKNLDLLKFLMTYHCKSDESAVLYLKENNYAKKDRKKYIELLSIFKDADALDRIRFGFKDLDINYLRNDVSKRLLLASKLAVSGLKLD